MTHQLLLADIAGRVTEDTAGSTRVTSAAVAVDPAQADSIRSTLAELPKWAKSTLQDVQVVVGLLERYGLGMAALSWDRGTEAWGKFWKDAKWVCEVITKQDRKRVSFAKPSTIARYVLFGSAITVATSHAVARGFRSGVVNSQGIEIIEQTLVVDTDFSGEETLDFLWQIWVKERAQPRMESAGFRLATRELSMKTENEEPLLLLPDYLAGIIQCYLVGDPGRIPFPIERLQAEEQLRRVSATGHLLVKNEKFNLDCRDLFPDVFHALHGSSR